MTYKEAPNGEGGMYWDEDAGRRELHEIRQQMKAVNKDNWLRMGPPGDFLDRDQPGFWKHDEDDW
jgi:hypothetical protein